MAAISRRGTATIDGTGITVDVILTGTSKYMQSMKGTQQYDVEALKDNSGSTGARIARDERLEMEFKMKLTGATKAAAALAVSVASTLGNPFLPPLQSLTLSGGDLASWAGVFQMETGTGVDLKNDQVAEFDLKAIKWADATQNTLLNTIPS